MGKLICTSVQDINSSLQWVENYTEETLLKEYNDEVDAQNPVRKTRATVIKMLLSAIKKRRAMLAPGTEVMVELKQGCNTEWVYGTIVRYELGEPIVLTNYGAEVCGRIKKVKEVGNV
jgi:hypothetical protein